MGWRRRVALGLGVIGILGAACLNRPIPEAELGEGSTTSLTGRPASSTSTSRGVGMDVDSTSTSLDTTTGVPIMTDTTRGSVTSATTLPNMSTSTTAADTTSAVTSVGVTTVGVTTDDPFPAESGDTGPGCFPAFPDVLRDDDCGECVRTFCEPELDECSEGPGCGCYARCLQELGATELRTCPFFCCLDEIPRSSFALQSCAIVSCPVCF